MSISNSKWTRLACFLLGGALLGYFSWQLGFSKIAQYLGKIGIQIIWPLLVSAACYLLNSLAWQQVIRDKSSRLSLSRLFTIKVAGEAVNSSTPVSWVGGDPVRIAMMKPFFSSTDSTTSVILDRTLHSFSTILMMGIAVLLALSTLHLDHRMRIGLCSIMIVLLISLAITLRRQHHGLLGGLVSIADKLRLGNRIGPNLRNKADQIDTQIRWFYTHQKGHLIFSLLLHSGSRLLGAVEIYVIALLLHSSISLLTAYYLAMLSALINLIFVLVPGSIGVLEGAYGGLFHLLSLDPAAGIAVQLVRRIRTLIWTGIGFVIISLSKPKKDPLG